MIEFENNTMTVVYTGEESPIGYKKAIFLAGPTPRSEGVESWRPRALELLEAEGYDGVVFVPEFRDGVSSNYDEVIDWETKMLNLADVVVVWVPRNLETMPAFTTNFEMGEWLSSGKVIYGRPDEAPKNRYLDLKYEEEYSQKPAHTLALTLFRAVDVIGGGSFRVDGERFVPLMIWKTPQFQSWYNELLLAGNRLDEAKQLWIFRMPKARIVFSYVLWVKVWINAEERYKENERIFSRTDISSVVLYALSGENGIDNEVVLVQEFRSTGRTRDGFVLENAGGSSLKPDKEPRDVAISEIKEETSLVISPDRLNSIGSRQVAATLSTHKCNAYSCLLSQEELEQAKTLDSSNQTFGVEEDSEKTYVRVVRLNSLLMGDEEVDWTTMGLILTAINTSGAFRHDYE